MPEQPSEQLIKELKGATPPTVPEKESAKERTEVKWSPEAAKRGKQLAGQIKELDQQVLALEERGDLKAAQAVHLDPTKTRRRAPVETLFDSFVSWRAAGNRLLEEEYDLSDVFTSGGFCVNIGRCNAMGMVVAEFIGETPTTRVGASLTR